MTEGSSSGGRFLEAWSSADASCRSQLPRDPLPSGHFTATEPLPPFPDVPPPPLLLLLAPPDAFCVFLAPPAINTRKLGR